MYINPFFAGVLATICVEVLCSFIYALQHNNKPERMVSVDLTPEQMKEMVERLEEIFHGEDDNNQGE